MPSTHTDVPNLRLFTTHEAPVGVLPQIRKLLEAAFDGDFSDEDWSHTLGGWHAVTCEGTAVVSHAAVVPRVLHVAGTPFSTGYVEGVATAPDRQRAGLASLVMRRLNVLLQEEFDFGALSTGRHQFYERHGWERWRGPTFVRSGATLVRTEDEDEGVMVLRFGPSVELDLTAAISCDSRTGDDW